ncbi:MAG: hypothetical protein LUE29_12095 [Lachnospiraceae bacterium]|nr:hypothetical protein [Lachnospiraceae bacterium]
MENIKVEITVQQEINDKKSKNRVSKRGWLSDLICGFRLLRYAPHAYFWLILMVALVASGIFADWIFMFQCWRDYARDTAVTYLWMTSIPVCLASLIPAHLLGALAGSDLVKQSPAGNRMKFGIPVLVNSLVSLVIFLLFALSKYAISLTFPFMLTAPARELRVSILACACIQALVLVYLAFIYRFRTSVSIIAYLAVMGLAVAAFVLRSGESDTNLFSMWDSAWSLQNLFPSFLKFDSYGECLPAAFVILLVGLAAYVGISLLNLKFCRTFWKEGPERKKHRVHPSVRIPEGTFRIQHVIPAAVILVIFAVFLIWYTSYECRVHRLIAKVYREVTETDEWISMSYDDGSGAELLYVTDDEVTEDFWLVTFVDYNGNSYETVGQLSTDETLTDFLETTRGLKHVVGEDGTLIWGDDPEYYDEKYSDEEKYTIPEDYNFLCEYVDTELYRVGIASTDYVVAAVGEYEGERVVYLMLNYEYEGTGETLSEYLASYGVDRDSCTQVRLVWYKKDFLLDGILARSLLAPSWFSVRFFDTDTEYLYDTIISLASERVSVEDYEDQAMYRSEVSIQIRSQYTGMDAMEISFLENGYVGVKSYTGSWYFNACFKMDQTGFSVIKGLLKDYLLEECGTGYIKRSDEMSVWKYLENVAWHQIKSRS